MNCPYCNKEMVSGALYADSYRPTWLTDRQGLAYGLFATGGEPIGKRSWFAPSKIKAARCMTCDKIIIDLNDQESD